MLKTGVSLSPLPLVGDMICKSGQEYCEDLNERAEDVSSTLIARSHSNTYVFVPCQFSQSVPYKR